MKLTNCTKLSRLLPTQEKATADPLQRDRGGQGVKIGKCEEGKIHSNAAIYEEK